jgi:hypothetical protein
MASATSAEATIIIKKKQTLTACNVTNFKPVTEKPGKTYYTYHGVITLAGTTKPSKQLFADNSYVPPSVAATKLLKYLEGFYNNPKKVRCTY